MWTAQHTIAGPRRDEPGSGMRWGPAPCRIIRRRSLSRRVSKSAQSTPLRTALTAPEGVKWSCRACHWFPVFGRLLSGSSDLPLRGNIGFHELHWHHYRPYPGAPDTLSSRSTRLYQPTTRIRSPSRAYTYRRTLSGSAPRRDLRDCSPRLRVLTCRVGGTA